MNSLNSSDIVPISTIIRKRLIENNKPYFANDNIADYISDEERDILQKEIEVKYRSLMESMIIDLDNDHNTKDTPKRVAKMYINEIFKGRYHKAPIVTEFPNAKELDEIYTVGPINIKSTCSHHFAPIIGQVWVGVLPSDKVIGLSKFNRIIDWIASRPHIQEEMSIMIADKIEDLISPKGLGIAIKAKHMCMSWRGVKEETTMINSIVRGEFRDDPAIKHEFFELIKSQGF